jgi:hypothetical protein
MELHLHFCHMHGYSDAPRYVLFSFKWLLHASCVGLLLVLCVYKQLYHSTLLSRQDSLILELHFNNVNWIESASITFHDSKTKLQRCGFHCGAEVRFERRKFLELPSTCHR